MAEASSSNNSALNIFQQVQCLSIPTVKEFEQHLVRTGGADLSSVDNGANEINRNKKKVRRKSRNKNYAENNILKTSVQEMNSIISKCDEKVTKLKLQDDLKGSSSATDLCGFEILKEMEITAVKSQIRGSVVRVKRSFFKGINTKFFHYLNENILKDSDLCCKCKCHITEKINNASTSRDYDKFTADSQSGCNSTINSQIASPINNIILQPEDANKVLKQNISTKSLKKKNKINWNQEMSLTKVRCNLESGVLIKGTIRINAKNFHEAYVSSNNEDESDYLLPTIVDRNKALEGDIVAIQLKPKAEWTERLMTAHVVKILERVHPRTAVGFLQSLPYNNPRFVTFIPRDVRIPKMKIPIKSCPEGFNRHPHRFENIFYRAKIVDWVNIKYAKGELLESLGFSGDLESETSAILAEYGLDVTPFEPAAVGLSKITDSIPIEEFAYREDVRSQCIFTIDPATARDLDDAVSCKELSNGNLEIGVHISDVSYYLSENSTLDKIVCSKATSVYMVNNVYHMLPEELCLHCSLLPGKDKLAFSVFWEMTKSGEIINERFARTIINSCVQLAYEHAQAMIENPNHIFKVEEFPQIYGGFTQRDLSKIVNYLQSIAVNLRKNRFDNGALRIDQTKLLFRINEATGEPLEFFVYENKEAHRLIEEFMLLANISVATEIANKFSDIAFLRCHDPPKMKMLVEVQKTLKNFDVNLDISSSKALQSSMQSLSLTFGVAQMAVLNHLLAKPMVRARYFCSGDDNIEDFSHFALSVPIYTHFTSPIRRYADIMVHRLLAATLNYTEVPKWNKHYVISVANNCNMKKYNAKCAGEASCDLYLSHYIAEHQPFVQDAVVVDVKQTSFEILLYSLGSVVKMVNNALGKDIDCEVDPEDNKKLIVIFNETSDSPRLKYRITLFSVVKVKLKPKHKTTKLEATLVRPVPSEDTAQQSINMI